MPSTVADPARSPTHVRRPGRADIVSNDRRQRRNRSSFRRRCPTVELSPRSKIEPRSTGGRSKRADDLVSLQIKLAMSTLVRSHWDAIGTPRSRCSGRGSTARRSARLLWSGEHPERGDGISWTSLDASYEIVT